MMTFVKIFQDLGKELLANSLCPKMEEKRVNIYVSWTFPANPPAS